MALATAVNDGVSLATVRSGDGSPEELGPMPFSYQVSAKVGWLA